MDISSLVGLGGKAFAAFVRLETLIKSGAIQKDIDDAKAVAKEVVDQIVGVLRGS